MLSKKKNKKKKHYPLSDCLLAHTSKTNVAQNGSMAFSVPREERPF